MPARPLDDLHDERGDLPVPAVQGAFERPDGRLPGPLAERVAVGVGVRHLAERRPPDGAGQPRAVAHDPRQAHGRQRHAVVRAVQRQDLGAPGHPHGQFDRGLDRLTPAGQDRDLGQPLRRQPGQPRAVRDQCVALVQDVRGRQRRHLPRDGLRHPRVGVADHRRPGRARHRVQVHAPVGVPQPGVLAAHQREARVPAQGMQHEPAVGVHLGPLRCAARARPPSRWSRPGRPGPRRSRW